MRRVLVTGGAGFIGAEVVLALLERWPDVEVLILDKLTYAAELRRLAPAAGRYHLQVGDVADPGALSEALRAPVDVVIHCAAETHVDQSIDAPGAFLETNLLGTALLLERLRAGQLGRLLLLSTDEVYGDRERPATRDDGLRASSPYAATKAGGDLLALAWQRTYGLPVTITRGSNTYGPWQHPEKLLPLALGRLCAGRPAPLYGDGHQRRDWLHVQDHARGVVAALEAPPGQIYHLATGLSIENRHLITLLGQELRRRGVPLPDELWVHVPDRPGHDRAYLLEVEGATPMGWCPRISLEEGLGALVASWLAEPGRWEGRVPALPAWLRARGGEG